VAQVFCLRRSTTTLTTRSTRTETVYGLTSLAPALRKPGRQGHATIFRLLGIGPRAAGARR
jgi:hypothetical protein